ncbi:putative exocyst complex component Exo70, cullin repeat-like-containing domain superfamily [Helianthus annuus]|nr:putative exocyst complex component Exo70, cullin repeat-like-containing domain superfamily [Helianthus annuus]KAJ0777620.1 putative exocyst complex component Exo70, cullin repeat-like-containing domain superfamily [Helianthus annuus]
MILGVVMEKMIVEVVVIVMKDFELRSDVYVDLVYADVIKELKRIVDRMIRSGYEKECCQVYCNVRRDVLDECLSILGVEKVSVEEVQRIECKLCEQVLSESELIKEVSFVESWIRKHSGQIRPWYMSYLRSVWEKVLLCLKDEGIGGGDWGSSVLGFFLF